MSFTNVLSIPVTTRSDKDKELDGFNSSTFGRLFFRAATTAEPDGDVFCSHVICTEFDSCLSVVNLGEC